MFEAAIFILSETGNVARMEQWSYYVKKAGLRILALNSAFEYWALFRGADFTNKELVRNPHVDILVKVQTLRDLSLKLHLRAMGTHPEIGEIVRLTTTLYTRYQSLRRLEAALRISELYSGNGHVHPAGIVFILISMCGKEIDEERTPELYAALDRIAPKATLGVACFCCAVGKVEDIEWSDDVLEGEQVSASSAVDL